MKKKRVFVLLFIKRCIINILDMDGMEGPLTFFVLMKILESIPGRYDLGIRLLTLGRLDAVYDRLLLPIQPGMKALDIGCGTGALSVLAARRGAWVKGMDINPVMLEIARQRGADAGLEEKITLLEMGVAELDGEYPESYDAVIAGLSFSEISPDELRFALEHTRRILKPGGYLLVADESRPSSIVLRMLFAVLRFPLAAVTWLLTKTTTHAVQELPEKLTAVGFQVSDTQYNWLHSFICLTARKPEEQKEI